MNNRRRAWPWLCAAVSFVVGLILVLGDSGAGWFLVILGMIQIGASTRVGQGPAASHHGLTRWGLVGVTLLLILLAILVGVLAACGRAPGPTPVPTQEELPNPASVFCEEQGGRLEIRTDASGGQAGFCLFADGSECDEWAYFRGECQPAGSNEASSTAAATPTAEVRVVPPEGWEFYTHPALGYSFLYPAGSTFESTDTARYCLVVGPLVDDEHWPWFNVAHPNLEDYHPPADADLRAWLVEHHRLAGTVVDTQMIAGEPAIHTRSDNGPQAYDDDRFYLVHDGQVYEITILHTGHENWTVYDIFLDSFRF